MFRDFNNVDREEEKPEPKVSFWDILKEVPGATKRVGSSIAGFGADILRSVPMVALSAGLSTPLGKKFTEGGKTQISPEEFGIEKIIGKEPIESFGTKKNRYQEYLKEQGFKSGEGLATAGVVAGTVLDSLFGSGKTAKMSIGAIAKESSNVKNILKELKSFNISDNLSREIAPKLLRETDTNKISQIVKSSEIISNIERRTGLTLPSDSRSKILESLSNTEFSNGKEANKVIKEVTDYFVSQAPKKDELIASTAKKLDGYSANLKDTDLEQFSIKADLDEIKSMLYQKENTAQDIIDLERQADDIVMEHIAKQGAKAKEADEMDELITLANKSNNFPEFSAALPVDTNKTALRLVKNEAELKDLFIKSKIDPKTIARAKQKTFGEAVAGKKVVAGTKKEDYSAIRRAVAAGGREVKRTAVAGKKAAVAAKRTGKKIGIFQQKAKDRTKIKEMFYKVKAKNETIENLKKSLRQYASDLPLATQRKILAEIGASKIRGFKQLKAYLGKVDRARYEFKGETARLEVWRDIRPLNKLAREKGILGSVNMRALKELGISSRDQLKNASKEKLEAYKNILMEALDTTPKKTDVSKVDWKKIAKEGGVGSSEGKTTAKKIGEGIESALGVVSTNIKKYGGEKLFSLVRESQFNKSRLAKKAAEDMEGFQKGMKKIQRKVFGDKIAYQNLSHALFNQDFARAKDIAAKFGFDKEIDKIAGLLSDIQKRAVEAGLNVGKMEDYFPRIVKDYDGLFKAYNEKFGKDGRSYLDSLLTRYASSQYKKVSQLTPEEKADVLTKALRGYGQDKINVGTVTRARVFKELPPEWMKYYHKPEDALVMYTSKMNERITLKKLFGIEDAEQDSIGGMLAGMNISQGELARLKESLSAILSPRGGENIVFNKIRKSATLTLLTSISSTLFQVADIGLNAYKHGAARALASLFRKKPFKREEMFVDISHEFADSNLIKNTLKAVGFDRLDRLNNEAFMGNAFREAVRYAKKGKGSGFDDLKKYADVVFRGDNARIDSFISDVASGKITEDTRLFIWNKVLDVQPRDLMEMAESYVKHPNARMFYSMKSYGIKVLDTYRSDVIREKRTWTRAKNFVKLTSYLTAAGATGSQIRDWYNGKDTKFSDNVMNNFFQIAMLSTYDAANIQRDGLGKAILDKALPPTRWINDLSKDIYNAGDGKGLDSVRNIPIIGSELYNRIGRGADKIRKANASGSVSQQRLIRSSSKGTSRIRKRETPSRLK